MPQREVQTRMVRMDDRVGKAGASDVPEVAETLAQAFFDDPVFRWWMPAEARRRQILPAFFAALCEAYLPWGQIHRSRDGLAAAIWAPPGAELGEEPSAALGVALAAAMGEYGDTMRELGAARGAGHPKRPHFYLHLLAARPRAQGCGYGSALLRVVLDRCDAEGIPAHLRATSADSRRLYERHGFVAREAVTVRDSPPLWLMWREPLASPGTMRT